MKRSSSRILTTHVGSLIRPPALQEFLRAKQAGKPFDQTAYEKCLADSVAEVVRQQAEAGIDVVSDGEFGKSISWSQYVLERLSGFERRPVKPGANPFARGADRDAVRRVLCRARCRAKASRRTTAIRSASGPITYTGQAELQRDIDNFKAALQGREGRGGVPAGGGAGERHPRPQERILQERGGTACARSPKRCAPNIA